MELLGWLGGVFLAICSGPEVYSAYKTKKCNLTWGFLNLWFGGEVLTALPVFSKIQEPFLMFNYGLNIILITYLIVVKWRSRLDAETL